MIPGDKDNIKLISTGLIEDLKKKAYKSERKRINFNFHPSMEDNPHRFLNILTQGTYIRPHCHMNPPKSESFIILEGCAVFFSFFVDGKIDKCFKLESLTKDATDSKNIFSGIDIAPGVIHTIIPISRDVVCYEVKPGPYEPLSDKDFAAWAPAEGEETVPLYLKHLNDFAVKQLKLRALDFDK